MTLLLLSSQLAGPSRPEHVVDGLVEPFAVAFDRDGAMPIAEFKTRPHRMLPSGDLNISDSYNNRILKITR